MKPLRLEDIEEHTKKAMEELGLTAETVQLITLFPMIYVAWMDREIEPKELQVILEVAKEQELDTGQMGVTLGKWLQEKPSTSFLKNGLYLTQVLMGAENIEAKGILLEQAKQVGKITEGILGIPQTIGANPNQAIQEISASFGLFERKEQEEAIDEARGHLTPKELGFQAIEWNWVQWSSLLIVCLLGGTVYLQNAQGYPILVPKLAGHSLTLSSLFDGPNAFYFVLLPLLPFFFGGLLVGWKSEGEIYTESILSALIPLAMYWIIWLALATQIKGHGWDGRRTVLLFTLTLLAGATAAVGAFVGDRLTSNRAVGA